MIQAFYFWYSLTFLIVRMVTLCWSAALVYQESRKVLKIINDVPSKFYYPEVGLG